jgi:two-component system response regulator PhoP|tara:strand:+ start:1369 stop:2055 length:687 start_codon:yes stop_codon:yes gene_type:complete
MKLLIVEDELKLRTQLCQALNQQDYKIEQAEDGEEALYKGLEYPIDLAIVDLGLPKMNGVEVIKKWRESGIKFPILILTARGHWQDKVEGLDAGADDYLVKPFHLAELLARVKALLRRFGGHSSSKLVFGNLTINLSAKQVLLGEQPIELTAYEYNTLEYLIHHSDRPVSKTELTEHLYDQDFDRDSNVIEVFIGRLRKKLDPSAELSPIKTVRGQGYRFELKTETKN